MTRKRRKTRSRQQRRAVARELREQCQASRTAFFYKQKVTASGVKIERPELDGRTWQEFPSF